MNRLMMIGLMMCAAASSLVAEEAAADPKPEPAVEEATVKKKKPPKKQAEYRTWASAAAVAEAWQQPVLALLEVSGDKAANKIKAGTICSQPFLKEFVPANVVYYHCVVPAKVNKNAKKGDTPKPDMEAMKDEERVMVSRMAGGRGTPSFPVVCLADFSGRVLDNTLCPFEDGIELGKFVDSVKTAMEKAKFEVKINAHLQKALDKEVKALEKAAKRTKK